MHGGQIVNRREVSSWVESEDNAITHDIRQTDFLKVDAGLNFIYGECDATNPDNDFIADALIHANAATLCIRDQSLFNSGANTNMTTILHGVAAYAIGAGGDPQTSNASSIVPWIATQAGPKADEDMRFAAFDGNDRLSKVLHDKTENVSLSSFGPGDNAYVWKGGVSLSADTTLNSLSLVNEEKSKQLGEGRTLTLTSGGLILADISWMAGASGIGEENGGAANGSLVLGDATHPAYVWARGAADTPNQIWAPVTAPGGFVAAHTGALVLGGDQTGIGDEIAVNAGTLILGTTSTACVLKKELPIRVYANATLSLPNAESATGNIVKFDGAAGWFGKVEVPAGVEAKCRKAYWRDYPETEEWQSIPRGVYTGDAETALATGATYDPDRFAGAGTIRVLKDDTTQPFVIHLR